mmetsp:Transcript_57940/g.131290  ORF Transcript_57940/g.131290 Transcript_57940/m.131290 type:complete len:241 (-) Transcript_57940:969-1691(-)
MRRLALGLGTSSLPRLAHVEEMSSGPIWVVDSSASPSPSPTLIAPPPTWEGLESPPPPPTLSIILPRRSSERLSASTGSMVAELSLVACSCASSSLSKRARWGSSFLKSPMAPCLRATRTFSCREQAALMVLSSSRPARISAVSSSDTSRFNSVVPIPLALSSASLASASSLRRLANTSLASTSTCSLSNVCRFPSCPMNFSTISSRSFTPVACRIVVNCSSSMFNSCCFAWLEALSASA